MKIELVQFEQQHKAAVKAMIDADRTNRLLFNRLFDDLYQDLRVICAENTPAGVLFRAQSGSVFYRMVFIAPKMRRKGIGSAVMRMEEGEFAEKAERLTAFFNLADSGAVAFAEALGYRRAFDSVYMAYAGEKKEVGQLPVRVYRDEDYWEAQKMYAEAFHRMRVQVGDFPDSVPAQPSEKGRAAWQKDAENYLLYEDNGEIVAVGHLNGDEIGSVSVRIDRQRNGIGSRFVPYLINTILERGFDTVHLECVVGNPARKLYDRLGFVPLYTQRFAEKRIG